MKNTILFASILPMLATHSIAAMVFFGEDKAGGSLPTPLSAAAETAFLSNLVGVTIENFEGVPLGTQFPINLNFGPTTATLTGTNTISSTGIVNTTIAGRFPISGKRYLNVGTSDAQSFSLSFSQPQAAFGFYATDIGDISGQLQLSFDGGAPVSVPHTITDTGSAFYYGYIDAANPFTTVTFANSGGNSDAFGFDNFTIGRVDQVVPPVPEPGTAIFGLALAGVAMVRRRR